LDLLAKMTVWHPVTGWSELARVGLNILLHFVGSSNSEVGYLLLSFILSCNL